MSLQAPFRAPIHEPFFEPDSERKTSGPPISFIWQQHLDITAQQLKTPAAQQAPSKSSDPGQFGQLASDQNFLYRHNGIKWQRLAFNDF